MALGFSQAKLSEDEIAALVGHDYWFVRRTVGTHASYFYINKKGQVFITASYAAGFILVGLMVVVFTKDSFENLRWPYLIAVVVLSAVIQVFISKKTIKRPKQSEWHAPVVTTRSGPQVEDISSTPEDKK